MGAIRGHGIMVYGRCPNHITEQKRTPRSDPWTPWNICAKWSIPQTRKMCLGTAKHQLSGANPWRGRNTHGPYQSCRHCKLADPKNCQTSSIIPRILQLLLTLHIPIFAYSKTPEWTNQEGYTMELGNKTARCLWNPQETNHIGTSTKTAPIRPAIWSRSGCIRVHHRSSPNAKRRNGQETPSCLLL